MQDCFRFFLTNVEECYITSTSKSFTNGFGISNYSSASSRDLWYLTFCFFRHAAHRRNVRTAPTMMPKQYTQTSATLATKLSSKTSIKSITCTQQKRSIYEYNMRVLEHAKRENDSL